MEAWHERRKTVFWTTESIKSLEDTLRANGLAVVPRYSAPDQCNVVDVPFAAKRRSYVRIKRLPEDHLELRAFCQRVQDELRLKLYYKGESAAVVGHKCVHEFRVRKREAIPEADKKALMDKQDGRCAKCNDVLGRWEVHHTPPVADGGGAQDICLVCPTCHAEETERQQLRGQKAPQHFESQLSPDMMNLFKSTPRPLQLCWGDAAARAHAMEQDDFAPIACMDVRGCRKNALLSRDFLPVGSPLDAVQPVFDDAGRYAAPLERFAWLWVEAPEERRHALYDGPHLYPTETVQVLMREGFLVADADSLPFGWIPSHRFPSSDLANAWSPLHRICGDDGTKETEKEKKTAKTMILATIGLWNRREHKSWTVRRTTHDDDMPGPVLLTTFRPDGSTLKLCATELHDNRTLLPVALLSLFDEQIHMHRARQIVARVPAIVPLGAYVDGLFYTGPPEAQ